VPSLDLVIYKMGGSNGRYNSPRAGDGLCGGATVKSFLLLAIDGTQQ
jgi:hypothetical protein